MQGSHGMKGGPAAALARVQQAVAANRAPSPADMQMLVSINVESIHGEVGSPGGLDRVRRLIVDLAQMIGANSVELQRRIARYECTAWLRERILPECPTRHAGRPEAICWEILRLYGHTPTARTIRRVLEFTKLRTSQGTRCPRSDG